MFKASPILSEDLPPETLEGVRLMFGQLPIVWALREGGTLRIPVAEVEATGPYILNLAVDQTPPGGPEFVLTVTKKS